MKKGVLYLGAVALVSVALWSCDQNQTAVEPETADTAVNSTARLAGDTTGFHSKKKLTKIAATELPATVSSYVSTNYSGATIAYAAKDDSGNILVALTQNNERKTLLFNSDGTFNREVARPEGRKPGPRGGRDSLQTVAEADLPANIKSYIAATYAGATIHLAAKDASRGYFVMITVNNEKKTLVFNTDGTFKEELVRKPKEKFERIDVATLPTAVTEYVSKNYAGSTIEVAGKNASGQFLVWVKPATGRPVALVFAADGTFVQKLEHRR
ncbi:PepSY-like domain-containing protein [Tellurirhabdus rosea]|uniref:PepSY-like domain-containing protein n=1 Tax=Tellurirhabdus rosea TaxID=2674997 RepID=UPI002259076A|nr:PepSY-like domain-containing protein [Tellurirhabdus rosea]